MAGTDASGLSRLRWFAGAATLLAACGALGQAATFRFAAVEEARLALSADDDWMAATGARQRAATTGSDTDASSELFKAVLARAARNCSDAEQRRWSRAATAAVQRLGELGLPVPSPVSIACTDGSDVSGAPYTRGRFIFLPARMDLGQMTDTELVVHEMVHLATRARPALATRLYRELGFEPVEPLAWPQEWQPLRIANPDAAHDRHAMRMVTPIGPQWLMPLVVFGRPARAGEGYLHAAQVRLLAVEPGQDGQPTRPLRRKDQLVWWDAHHLHGYLQRLGGNTQYIFHPEETLADNIAFLASGRPVPNPALLERLRAVLAEAARSPLDPQKENP